MYFLRVLAHTSTRKVFEKIASLKLGKHRVGRSCPIWSLLCAVRASEDCHNYIVSCCDRFTNRKLLPIENGVRGVEINVMSIEGLKMIISRLNRPTMKMFDHCGHPDEKHIVKRQQLHNVRKCSKCSAHATWLPTVADMAEKLRFKNDLRS